MRREMYAMKNLPKHRMPLIFVVAMALLGGTSAVGCASMHIQTPSGFAQLPDQ